MNQDLKIIKKKYGENMEKLCRQIFPVLLETEGLLSKLMLENFEPNHTLYKDIIDQNIEDSFKDYIYSLLDVEENKGVKTSKTPKELLNEVGYELYECHSEEEIMSFKKYYAKGEELCTFNGGRLNRCRVFFAVKKDVNQIKRQDYKNPKRQDKYGTSVISIQFTKDDSHTLSIKNRYNHKVSNPDSTFSNNLDNIVKGLTESFEKKYGLVQKHKNTGFEIQGYVTANDGKYYKYNQELDNIYYCPNNIIIDNFEVKRFPKEKFILFDYFILDLVKKEIRLYDETLQESFTYIIKEIEKIQIETKEHVKTIKIKVKQQEEMKIVLNEDNKIRKLENPNIKKIGDNFLNYNKSLQELSLPNLQEVGDHFLHNNETLQELSLPNLQKVRDDFLFWNELLQELSLPNLQKVGDYFLYYNKSLQELSVPNLQEVGTDFLFCNESLQELSLPNLQKVGDNFLNYNKSLQELSVPNLQEVGTDFLFCNESLQELSLPNLQEVGDYFLYCNETLQELSVPNLQKIGDYFLYSNKKININNLKDNRRK